MSPKLHDPLHDPNCPGRLNSVELDGGEATLLSCSDCQYYSCSDSSLIEYPEDMSDDRPRENTTGSFKAYEDASTGDDLTYVWYPDIDSISSDSLGEFDEMKYLTNEKPTCSVRPIGRKKSSCSVTQPNQSILTASSEHVTELANNNSQCKTPKHLQRHISQSKSAVTTTKPTRSLSCVEINEALELVPCPKCQSPNTRIVDEDSSLLDELNIRYCKDCGECFGLDDSMDLDDLQRLLEEHKIVFKSNAILCKCGNDDVEKFVLSEVDKVTVQVMIKCQECGRQMPLEIIHGDDEGFVDEDEDGWVLPDSFSDSNQTEDTSLDSGVDFEQDSLEKTLVQDQPSFRCNFCNHAEDDLFEKQRDIHGRVTSAKCLVCDGIQNVMPPMLCPICRNNKDFETCYDNEGNLIYAACRNCLNPLDLERNSPAADYDMVMSSEAVHRSAKKQPVRRRIYSINDVSIGDHVALHKEYVLWHHAIVVSVRPRDRKLTVVHYTGGLKKRQGHFVSVREEELELDFDKDEIYVCDYGKDCIRPQDVVTRARSRVGEHKYNLLAQNCEHFAHWCKTGEGQSSQVKAFCRRLWKACGSAVGAGVREGVVTACRGLVEGIPAKQVFQVGLKGGIERVQGVAGGTALAAGLKGGAVVFDVFLNLALEVGLFAYGAHKSRQKYKSGEITKEEFYREVCQSGCECAGGFLGATGGGFLGQLAIPVPFLGSLVGCTLGTLIGRFLGSIVGKKIGDRLFNSM